MARGILLEIFINNFQGKSQLMSQKHGESIRAFFNRFSNIRSQVVEATNTMIGNAFMCQDSCSAIHKGADLEKNAVGAFQMSGGFYI